MSEIHLYVVAHKSERGFCGPVKVGISHNADSRLQTLQTGNPRALALLWAFKLPNRAEARRHEGFFHRQFGERRLCGEWYDITPTRAIHLLCASMRVSMTRHPGGKFALLAAGVDAAEIQFRLSKTSALARAA